MGGSFSGARSDSEVDVDKWVYEKNARQKYEPGDILWLSTSGVETCAESSFIFTLHDYAITMANFPAPRWLDFS
jgi:hypothetical protein